MFNLIIVDDEEIITTGLAKYVNWHALGFQLVGTGYSVASALELVENHDVDVILSDIQMDDGTGLQLIEQVKNEYPHIKTVILSGYGEFQYAQQALRLGSSDFLTKPVEFDVLRQTFHTLFAQLQEERQSRNISSELQKVKRNLLLNSFVRDASFIDEEGFRCEFDIHQDDSLFILRIRLNNNDEIDCIQEEIFSELSQLFEDFRSHIFSYDTYDISVLFVGHSFEEISAILKPYLSQKSPLLIAGISNQFQAFRNFSKAFHQAGRVLDFAVFAEGDTLISYNKIENSVYNRSILTEKQVSTISELLSEKDTETLREFIVQTIQDFSHNHTLSYTFGIEFYMILDKFLSNYLPEYSNDETLNSIKTIYLQSTTESITKHMLLYIEKMAPSIELANPYSSAVIPKIKKYISLHYSENISLNTLAEQFFLHPIYLSKLFKDKTGQNFIDYLTHVRFQAAKQFLSETDLKVYEISVMCGYESSKYFSKIFKQLSGQTPKEFRNNNIEA
ncbi:MAG: response regulator [Eubacteriales bacterium]